MPQVIAEAVIYVIEAWGVSATAAVAVANMVVTAVYYAATSALLGAAVKALSPSQPKGAGRGLEINVTDATSPMRLIYGTLKVGGVNVIPPFNSGGSGEVLHQVLALAGRQVDSITDVYFNQAQITSASIGAITGGVNDGLVSSGVYANFAYIRRYVGTASQTCDYRLNAAFPTAFTTDFCGRGIAYIAIDFVFNQDVYPAGLPAASCVVKGHKLYDPRLDVSPGASPTNPSYVAWSDNPALVLADYLMSDLGGGYDPTEIDWGLVVAAANVCSTSLSGGSAPPSGAQSRYTCNLLLQATDDFLGNCKLITDTMLGRFQFRDGQWRIYAGAWASPVHNMDESAFTGPVTIQASAPRDQRYNSVRAFFVNPSKNWQRVECFPRANATYKSADGAELISKEIELPGVTDEYRAQYISEILLRQSRNQIVISGPVGPQWQRLALWETVSFDWPDMGWVSKTFRVVGYSITPSGGVDLGLAEEQSGDWADLITVEYGSPSTSTIPATNPTAPSAPQNLTVAALMGEIEFAWDRPIITPDNTRYELWKSSGSLWNANSSELAWSGDSTHVLIPMQTYSDYWWHVRGVVANSTQGPFQPNTSGLYGRAYLDHVYTTLTRAYPNGEMNMPQMMNSCFIDQGINKSNGGVVCFSMDTTQGLGPGRGSIVWTGTPGRSSGSQSRMRPMFPRPGDSPDLPFAAPGMRGVVRFTFMRMDSGYHQFVMDLQAFNAQVTSRNGAMTQVGSIMSNYKIWPGSYLIGEWNTVVYSFDVPNTPTITHIDTGISEFTAKSGQTRIGEWQVLLQ